MHKGKLDEILVDVYRDSPQYIDWVISKYSEYYNLPIIRKTIEVTPRLFQFYARNRHFLVIALANQANEILVIKDTQALANDTDWQLVGGFIHRGETLEAACERFVQKGMNLPIDGVEPIAIIENVFVCQEKSLSHIGLAFLILTHGNPCSTSNHKSVFVSHCPQQLALSNQEVLKYGFEKLSYYKTFTPYDEIDSNQKHKLMRFIHKSIISRIVHQYSSQQLKNKISEYCNGAYSIIDVACGDDTLILDLAHSANFCVANDISWTLLRRLRRESSNKNIIFTNHNALSLPFRKQFDVLICKNVLHHVHNIEEFVALVKSIRGIGKRLILVDIENPRKSSFRARLWNDYYRFFLGDIGNYFLTQEEFTNALACVYDNYEISFDTVSTIKGNYMIAVVDSL